MVKIRLNAGASFRVARRYKPYDVSFNELNDKVFFEGKFDGYSKLIGDNLIHHRKIEIEKEDIGYIC